MIKVKIKNKEGLVKFTGYHPDQLSADAWIAQESANESWGKNERWVLHKDEEFAPPYDEADVLEERLNDLGIGNPKKEVKLKAEYTVEIEDITAQIQAEQAQVQALQQAQLAAAARLESFDSEIDQASDLASLKAKIKTFVMDVAILLKK